MEYDMKLLTGLILLGFLGSCHGSRFYVGGKDGWVIDPRESFNHWAEKNRFQVNDTLDFKYKQGSDSVLVVNEEAYHTCNKSNPIKTLNDGNSKFKFKRSGPFFFISGQASNCEEGQKLFIVVMAVIHYNSHKAHSPATPPTPSPLPAPAPAPANSDKPETRVPQTTDKPETHVPAPAPATSAVAPTGFGGWVGLILGLSLVSSVKGF